MKPASLELTNTSALFGKHPPNSTENSDNIPLTQKIAFTFGLTSDHYAMQGMRMMVMPVYNVMLGINPALVGSIMAAARLWDAFTDAYAGNFTDNCRSKFGRRRPFIALGAVFTGLCFPLIWMAPEYWSDMATILYLCLSLLLFYSSYTLFSVSYESIGMEMTACYVERSRLFAFRSMFQKPLSLGIPWLVALSYLDYFSDPLVGARFVSIAVGIIIIAGGLITAYFCEEKYLQVAQKQEKIKIWKSLLQIRSNKPVVTLISIMALKLFGITLVGTLGFYVNAYYLFDGDIKSAAALTGVGGTLKIICAVFGAMGAYWLADRISKEHLLLICLIVMTICNAATWFTYMPNMPYLSLITVPFITAASSVFWVTIISMKADACDWEEFNTGIRREGMISGVVNWFNKVGMSIGLLFSGSLLVLVGFDSKLEAAQSPETITSMRVIFSFLPCFTHIVCVLLVLKYPLSKTTVAEVRETLELRRGKV